MELRVINLLKKWQECWDKNLILFEKLSLLLRIKFQRMNLGSYIILVPLREEHVHFFDQLRVLLDDLVEALKNKAEFSPI